MACNSCGRPLHPALRRCPACQAANTGESTPQDRRVASVLATTLRPADGGAEPEDPEEVLHLAQALAAAVADVARRFGGVPDRVFGLRAMVRFGVPFAQDDDAERATAAAAALSRLVVAGAGGGPQRGAAAVATGPVVAGEGAVRGEAIEVAEALVARTPAGEAWLDAETAHLVADAFQLADGTDGAWRVIAPVHRSAGPLAADRGLVFGRDAERLKLEGAWCAARGGRPQVATLLGPEGSGKTRLAGEIWRRANQDDALTLYARGSSYRRGLTFGLVGDLAEAWTGVTAEEGDPQAIATWLADHPVEDRARTGAALTYLLRLGAAPGAEAQGVAPRFTELLLAEAARRPVLVVLDDLQDADDASLRWVGDLVGAFTDAPAAIALVLVTRDGAPLRRPPDCEHLVISLGRLSEVDGLAAIGAALGLEADPAAWDPALRTFGEALAARAEGNPFVLHELLRWSREAGYLAAGPAGWEAVRQLDDADLPSSVRSLAAARLDRLSAGDRRVLGVAAALGDPFDDRLLAELVGHGPAEAALSAARSHHLVRPVEGVVHRHAFTEAMVRATAYQALLLADRRAVHARIAASLARHEAEALGAAGARIAHHAARAGDLAGVARFGALAAEHARGLGRLEEALAHTERALAAQEALESAEPDPSPECVQLLADVAELHEALGRHPEALAALERLCPLRAPADQVELRRRQGLLLEKLGRYDEALEVLGAGRALATQLGHPRAGAFLGPTATVEMRRGRFAEALALCREALAGGAPDDPYLHAVVGICHQRLGDRPAGLAAYRQALAGYEQAFDDLAVARTLNSIATLHLAEGQTARAGELFERALAVSRRIGNLFQTSMALLNLGEVHRHMGDLAAARQRYEEALALKRRIGQPQGITLALFNLGAVAHEEGNHREAVVRFEACRELWGELGFREYHAELLVALAEAQLGLGYLENVRQVLAEATSWVEGTGQPQQRALVQRAIARLRLAEHRPEDARTELARVLDLHAGAPDPLEEARTWLLLGDVEVAAGDPDAAERAYASARTRLEAVEAPPLQREVEARLEGLTALRGSPAKGPASRA